MFCRMSARAIPTLEADKLLGGPATNFFAWRKRIGPQLQRDFGRQAHFANGTGLGDAVPFSYPPIVESDWLPAGDGAPELTVAQKNSLYMDFVKIRSKLTLEMPDKRSSMFAALQAEISAELWTKVETHADFTAALDESCPYSLWNIVIKVALTQRDAHDANTRILAKLELTKNLLQGLPALWRVRGRLQVAFPGRARAAGGHGRARIREATRT